MKILVYLLIALIITMVVFVGIGEILIALACYAACNVLIVIIAIMQGNKAETEANRICNCKCKGEHCETK